MASKEYRNLMAEMARTGITANDIARVLKKDIRTAKNKISGETPFYINECFLIQKTFFPHLSIEYLFNIKSVYTHNTTTAATKTGQGG